MKPPEPPMLKMLSANVMGWLQRLNRRASLPMLSRCLILPSRIVFTSPANPSLTFPLTSGNTVDSSNNARSSACQTELLTRQLAAGNEVAFREFHAQYFDRLYHFLLVVCHGQEPEAQDALQQTLLRVIRYVRPFESEEVFWCWLKTVARCAARDINRKQKRYATLIEAFAVRFLPPSQEDHCGEGDRLSVALEESLAELPGHERRLLEAKYIEGCTVKELAVETGLSFKAVESRLERLRRAVRASILGKISRK
jgi:RNA polymerase sigma-70 factor (ECF subfamily)